MCYQRAEIRRSQRLEPSSYGGDPRDEILMLPSGAPYRGSGTPASEQPHLQQV